VHSGIHRPRSLAKFQCKGVPVTAVPLMLDPMRCNVEFGAFGQNG
jgi:hypothetical protein